MISLKAATEPLAKNYAGKKGGLVCEVWTDKEYIFYNDAVNFELKNYGWYLWATHNVYVVLENAGLHKPQGWPTSQLV